MKEKFQEILGIDPNFRIKEIKIKGRKKLSQIQSGKGLGEFVLYVEKNAKESIKNMGKDMFFMAFKPQEKEYTSDF